MRHPRRFIWAGVFWMAALMLLSGCGRYEMGRTPDTPFQTLHIKTIANESMAPQAQALVSGQIRDHILRDGRIRLVGPDQAQGILEITLSGYSREVGATRAEDTALARKFTMAMVATCTLIDTRTGNSYFENRTVDAARDAFIDEGALQSEYQTMPVLAENLSRQISNLVLHVW